MITYFIKSGLCLALLLTFYHLVLEREKMHIFNRFFLLGSVLFSFLAPLYVIYEYIPVVTHNTEAVFVNKIFVPAEVTVEKPFNYSAFIFGLYGVVSLILFVRFCKNLFSIVVKINKNQQIKQKNATVVLVNDSISPHTFLNYIFINKKEYFSEKIQSELLTHELAHVTQKHTIDILFIEFLQILFWINPTFIFLKRAIKLNHEFLADNKVIVTHKNTIEYQHLLLNSATYNNEYYLASNLNYLLTKKRLQMMTKQSSRISVLLKKVAVLPLLVGFVFLFAQRIQAQEKADPKVVAEYNKLAKKYNNQPEGKQVVKLKEVQRMSFLYGKLTSGQKQVAERYPNIPPPPPSPVIKKGMKSSDGKFIPPPPPPPKKVGFIKQVKEQAPILSSPGEVEVIEEVEFVEEIESNSEVKELVPTETIQETTTETGFVVINKQTVYYVKKDNKITYYNRFGQKIDKNGTIISKVQTKSDEVIPNQNINKVYKDDKVVVEFKNNNLSKKDDEITRLSPSVSPLELLKKEDNTHYYYNGNEINYKKALDLLKNSRPINILEQRNNGKKIVKLFKAQTKSDEVIPNKSNNLQKNDDISYFLDGKPISRKMLEKMEPNKIESIYVKRKGREKKVSLMSKKE